MSIQNLPEVRFADYLTSIGVFDPILGETYQKQIGFFDEDRLDENDERGIAIISNGENIDNGDLFEDINISLHFISKKIKSDYVDVNIFSRKVQQLIIENPKSGDIYGLTNNGRSTGVLLESGRMVFELKIRMQSNYCPL